MGPIGPVGILALQGDYDAHRKVLEGLGAPTLPVKLPGDLREVTGLVFPGGESTTLLRLMDRYELTEPIRQFCSNGRPVLATCAGCILLAREVRNPHQRSLGVARITVKRNAYGRQRESFVARSASWNGGPPIELVFIRAPVITRVDPDLDILLRYKGDPVLVQQDSMLLATFHPELSEDTRIHQLFLDIIIAESINLVASPHERV
jgi:5'-phosphate synthase pdxT subunit